MPTTPVPTTSAPELSVDLLGGGAFKLADETPENFTMVVFYRGLHCPVCRTYNRSLDRNLEDLRGLGVEVVAVSMDDADRASQSKQEWELSDDLRVGYGLTEQTARAWGLYISSSIKDEEPATFSEPGLFLVRPGGELFYAAVNSMPWGRPKIEDFAKGLDWILDNDYPARGVES